MVVPVQEDQWLLPQYNEHSVTQFRELRQDKHPRPESRHSVLFNETGDTDGVVDAVVPQDVEQLRGGAGGAANAEQRERRVPHGENAAEVVAGATLHVPLAAENDQHVDARVVEAIRPVFGHPHARILVHELLFEVEHVRVVGGGPHLEVSTVHLGVRALAALTAVRLTPKLSRLRLRAKGGVRVSGARRGGRG